MVRLLVYEQLRKAKTASVDPIASKVKKVLLEYKIIIFVLPLDILLLHSFVVPP